MKESATNKTKGTLYLIPCSLSEESEQVIPAYVKELVRELDFFIVENAKSARRYLREIGYEKNFDEVKMFEMDKHAPAKINEEVALLFSSEIDAGLISEAGLPALADPGNIYVRFAHENNISVKPLVGPSSVTLALIASGMNGQRFRFHGYIPVEQKERIKKILEMEKTSGKEDETQIFIETPYRNQSLLQDILKNCQPQTSLCIAADLTSSTEFVKTKTIQEWKKNIPDINKRPAVFLIYK